MLRNLDQRLRSVKLKFYLPEVFILLFAFLTRFVRLGNPPNFIFDEVYHAFTAQQMFKGNHAAWEWWNTPPTGFAYEWTHPPIAKEFMVLAIYIYGDNAFAWRFFSAVFGVGSIVLVYFIARVLFKDRKVAIFSSLALSLDGLFLTMSRIAMNDSYFLFFALLAILLFLKKRKLLMAIFLGLAIASKWTGIFAIVIIFIVSFFKYAFSKKEVGILKFIFQQYIYLFLIPLLIYLVSYLPFFLGKHSPPYANWSNLQTFIELQRQMWWYHTSLKATHSYQSTPIQWIFDLRPVWLFVNYQKNSIANIYTLGNPLFMWFGLVSVVFLVWEFIKKQSFNIGIILIFYLGFFIPWIFSPRIMFNYHYLPSVPFLAIAIGFVLNRLLKVPNGKILVFAFFLLLFFLFFYFYPLWVAIYIPKGLYNSYFWFSSWK